MRKEVRYLTMTSALIAGSLLRRLRIMVTLLAYSLSVRGFGPLAAVRAAFEQEHG